MTDLAVRAVFTAEGKQLTATADQAASSLDKVKKAANDASTAGDKLAISTTAAEEALKGEQRAAELAAAALGATGQARLAEIGRLEQMAGAAASNVTGFNALSAAQAAYQASVVQANASLASGTITQAQHAKAMEQAVAQLALARVANDANTAALVKEGEAATAIGNGLRGMGQTLKQTGREAVDFEQIIARLTSTLGRGGGAISLFRAALPGVIGVLGTAGTAALTAAAGIGVLVAAEQHYQQQVYDLDKAIQAHGNQLNLNRQQYDDLIAQIARVAGVSESSARTILSTFVEANVKSSDVILKGTSILKDYQATIGVSGTKASQALAQIAASPSAAAEKLAAEYHNIDAATLDYVRSLEASGQKGQAALVVYQKLGEAAQGNADKTTIWRRSIEGVSTAWQKLLTGVGGAVAPGGGAVAPRATGPDPQETIEAEKLLNAVIPLRAKLNELDQQATEIKAYAAHGALSQADAEKALAAIQKSRADAIAQQNREAIEAAKERARQIAELIQRGTEQVSEEQLQADAALAQAAASATSTREMRALQDQYEVQRATLPYVIALRTADGKAAKDLTAIINALTDAIEKQQKARAGAAAVDDIRSGMQSLSQGWANGFDPTSGGFALDSLNSEFQKGISTHIFDEAVTAANDWRDSTIQALKDAGIYTDQYGEDVEQIFRDKVAQAYQDDLARRTDWQAGVERGYDALQRKTADWASTSERMTTGFAQNAEDAFVKAAKGGKGALDDFLNWIEDTWWRALYQKLLGPQMNSLANLFTDAIGKLLGNASGGSSGGGSFGGGGGGGDPIGDLINGIFGGGGGGDPLAPVNVTPQVSADVGSGFFDNIGSWLSDAGDWIAGLFHTGGVGARPSATRAVNPLLFAGAPRYHAGVDLRKAMGLNNPHERPAVILDNERVQTKEQADATDAALAALSRPIVVNTAPVEMPKVVLNIQTPPGTTARVSEPRQGANGDVNIEAIIDHVDNELAQRTVTGNSAHARALQNTYGLRRAVG